MNKIRAMLLWAALSAATAANAQVTSGTITYNETLQFKMDLPSEMAQLKNGMPHETHITHALAFSPEASVYSVMPTAASAAPMTPPEDGTLMVHMNVESSQEIFYRDLKSGETVVQKDLFSRKFLVRDSAKKIAWRPTGKQKDILGYACQEAVYSADSSVVAAWFTTSIPVSSGPDEWAGLPGMILEVIVTLNGQTQRSVVATKVQEGLGKTIQAPSTGKKVTRAEFASIEAEKAKEMKQQFGGNGTMIFRVTEH